MDMRNVMCVLRQDTKNKLNRRCGRCGFQEDIGKFQLERRVKRLELILLKEAENKIASLSDREAGKKYKDGYLSIEDIIDRRTKAERKYVDPVMYM